MVDILEFTLGEEERTRLNALVEPLLANGHIASLSNERREALQSKIASGVWHIFQESGRRDILDAMDDMALRRGAPVVVLKNMPNEGDSQRALEKGDEEGLVRSVKSRNPQRIDYIGLGLGLLIGQQLTLGNDVRVGDRNYEHEEGSANHMVVQTLHRDYSNQGFSVNQVTIGLEGAKTHVASDADIIARLSEEEMALLRQPVFFKQEETPGSRDPHPVGESFPCAVIADGAYGEPGIAIPRQELMAAYTSHNGDAERALRKLEAVMSRPEQFSSIKLGTGDVSIMDQSRVFHAGGEVALQPGHRRSLTNVNFEAPDYGVRNDDGVKITDIARNSGGRSR